MMLSAPIDDGSFAFIVPDTAPLHELVLEMWRRFGALPLGSLREFEKRTRGLPRTTEAERLDVYNGLLLAAHLDAAFDAGLTEFDDAAQSPFAEFLPAIVSRPVSTTRWRSPSSPLRRSSGLGITSRMAPHYDS